MSYPRAIFTGDDKLSRVAIGKYVILLDRIRVNNEFIAEALFYINYSLFIYVCAVIRRSHFLSQT